MEEMKVLKDKANFLITHGGKVSFAHLGHFHAVYRYRTARRPIQAAEDVQEGLFTTT